MYRLKMKKRKDGTVGKLMRLFVNSNNTNRGKRVALLQDKWSPAVGSSVCIKGKLCSALPPLPSARGSMSTFSLDPWRWLNTKLHRENVNALVGCYSAKPPLPLSHSTDTVSSPSAIVRTDRRMPLPVSAAHTREPTRDRLPVYFMDGTVEYHSADDSIVDCFFCCGGLMIFHSLFWQRGSKLCMMSFFSSPQSTCMGALRLWLAGAPKQQLYRWLPQLGFMYTHCCFISYS